MSAISDARDALADVFRLGSDPARPKIEALTAAYHYEPKPGDPQSPYLSIWQDGATADDQFFSFQVRVYVSMEADAESGQLLFDEINLEVDGLLREEETFIVTGWQTQWDGNLIISMFDVLYGRTDVW